MPLQQFATFKDACNYKIEDKQFECGTCRHFTAEAKFIRSESNWGTCPHHSHAFLRFRRACYSFEKQ